MQNEPNTQTGTIARSAGTVSFAVFTSRILGLIREQVFAMLFGAGYAYDAFVVAFRIPNLLRDLFAEGALSSAFVAVFTDYRNKRGTDATWQLTRNVISAIVVIVGALVLLGIVLSGTIVSVMAPDFSLISGKHELTTLMTSIMFPFLLLVSLSAVVMGILNSLGKFFIPSLASSFFNLGSILTGVALYVVFSKINLQPIIGMAIGILIGGSLQLFIQLPLLRRHGFTYRWALNFKDGGLRRIMRLMVPAIIGLSATQINIFVNTFFASSCAEGSVSWLNYAFRLMMFPIGLIGVSLAIATMPVVSMHASKGDVTRLREAFVSSIALSFMLTIPASCGLVFLSRPIVHLIFEHGNFHSFDTAQTASALSLYAIGLFAYASVKIIVPVFYALDKTRYPVMGSFMAVVLNILFVSFTLKTLQHNAIALSTSLCAVANFLFLSTVLFRLIKGFPVGYLLWCLGKVSCASFIMGIGALWLNDRLNSALGMGLFADTVSLFTTIALAVLFYFIALSFMRIKELNYLTERIKTRLKDRM